MPQICIGNSGEAGNIPIFESTTGMIDATMVTEYSIPAGHSSSDPYYVIGTDNSSKPGVRCYDGNDNHIYIPYNRDTMVVPPYSAGGVIESFTHTLVIAAIHITANQSDTLYYCVWGGDAASFVSAFNNHQLTTDGILYDGTYSAYSANFVEVREWDDTPSEDPDNDPFNELPQGGEYADLMSFSDTDQQTLTGMLPNPEATMNMNYGGMLRTYVLSQSYLTAVSSALFATNFWTQLKNKFNGLSDPLEMIVNCIQIPVAVGSTSSGTFRIGGVELEDDDGNPVSVQMTSSRYMQLDFGSVTLKEVWGSAKDYSDCSISIYLPYVGVKELDPDICIGCTLTLKGTLDYWTGDVLYLLHVSNADMSKKYFAAQSFAYRWSGNCGKTVPIGRVDTTNKMLGIIGTIAGLTAGAAAVGVGLGGAASGVIGAAGLASQGMAGAATGSITAGIGTATTGMAVMGATTAKALHSGFKPTVQSSSGVSGAPGQMDIQKAYIMVKRGVPKYPNGWRDTIGAPNYQTFSGVSMSGYTLFSEIHLTGMGDAAEEERAELERILCEEGVIL